MNSAQLSKFLGPYSGNVVPDVDVDPTTLHELRVDAANIWSGTTVPLQGSKQFGLFASNIDSVNQ